MDRFWLIGVLTVPRKVCPHGYEKSATSRENLNIVGEAIYRVPSLSIPDAQQVLDTFRSFESVNLFEARAQLSQFDFSLKLENISFVARICHRLDGIPLAIELAAAKVGVLSVEQIAQQLDESFHLLADGSRTALPRHQTLRASLNWSWDLLTESEQIFMKQLSVFAGGWTLEAAQAVCEGDVLMLTNSLLKKSLIMMDHRVSTKPRYRFHEAMRQFVNEKLNELNEIELLHNKHLEYFTILAEHAEPHLRRKEQIDWLVQLKAENDNLRTALSWAEKKPYAEPSFRLGGSLGIFWLMESNCLEGAAWLDRILNKTWGKNIGAEKAFCAKALYCRACIADELDELETMKITAKSALEFYEELKDQSGILSAHVLIASCQMRLKLPKANISESLKQYLYESRKKEDVWCESQILRMLAYALRETGTRDDFVENIKLGLSCARLLGDRRQIASMLIDFAVDPFVHGDLDEAEKLLIEAEQLLNEIGGQEFAIDQVRHLRVQIFFVHGDFVDAKMQAKKIVEHSVYNGDKHLRSINLTILALIAEADGDLYGAEQYAYEALELKRTIGVGANIAIGLIHMGLIKNLQGNIEDARQYILESFQFIQCGDVNERNMLIVLSYLSSLLVVNKPQDAVRLLALSESLSQSLSVPRQPVFDKPYFDRFLSASRAKLSLSEFTAAWNTGINLTIEDAIEIALKGI